MDLENEPSSFNKEIKSIELLSKDSILEEMAKIHDTEEDVDIFSSESLERKTEDEKEQDSTSHKKKGKKGGKEEEEELVIRYFTPREVAEHNTCDDLWVSWLGNVYDLTSLALEHRGNFFFFFFILL